MKKGVLFRVLFASALVIPGLSAVLYGQAANQPRVRPISSMGGVVTIKENVVKSRGTMVGRVHEVNYSTGEVMVRQNRTLAMGARVFVVADGNKIYMTVTFPMQSVSKCLVPADRRSDMKYLRKDMEVYAGK